MLDRAKLIAALDGAPFSARATLLGPIDHLTKTLQHWLADPTLCSLEDVVARDGPPQVHLAAALLIRDVLQPASTLASARERKWRVVVGDLHIDEDLEPRGGLMILGNLVLGGSYLERATYARLVVTGDVTLHHCWTAGDIAIAGNLRANGVIFGFENDHSLLVGGTLAARAVMLDDHEAKYESLLTDAGTIMTDDGAFIDDVLVDGALDRSLLRGAMKRGRDVLRPTTPNRSLAVSPRVAQLVRAARESARFELTRIGERDALRIERADGGREVRLLSSEELAALRALLS